LVYAGKRVFESFHVRSIEIGGRMEEDIVSDEKLARNFFDCEISVKFQKKSVTFDVGNLKAFRCEPFDGIIVCIEGLNCEKRTPKAMICMFGIRLFS
jgi:hypothetical protein